MNEDQRLVLARSWIEKADAALLDARLLLENDRLHSCVNRLYYAVFYAASAVLAYRNQAYGKHSAVRSAFHRDFVNTGLVKKEHGRMYDILLGRREQSDYQPAITFQTAEVAEYMNAARQIIDACRSLVSV